MKKVKLLNIFLFICITILLLSSCSNKNKDTIKLAFSKYDINETLTSDTEIAEYTNLYCEFYRMAIQLYNYEIKNNYSNSFDSYTEYNQLKDIAENTTQKYNSLSKNKNIDIAKSMQENINITLGKFEDINKSISKESLKLIYEDIVYNYEFIINAK